MTDTLTERAFNYDMLDPIDADELRAIAGRVRYHANRSIGEMLAIGQELGLAQDRLANHSGGDFRAWLATEFRMSHETAYKFIRVSEQFSGLSSHLTTQTLGISFEALAELARESYPADVRESFVPRIEAGERILLKEVRDARKEANAKVEAADLRDDDSDLDKALLAGATPSPAYPALPFPYPDGLHATADDERIAEETQRLRDEREASKTQQLRDETELLTKTRAFFREHEEDMAPERLLLRVKNATHEALAMAYDFEEIGNERVFGAMRGNPQQVAELSRMIDACQRAIKVARIVVPANAVGLRRVV